MNTPIWDFVRDYQHSDALRFHMPGHKGRLFLGMESMDITEIPGADSLFHAEGIIAKSEQNASKLFGSHCFYSTEGSSLCIRAMLYLCTLHARSQGRPPVIAAGRNAHKVLLSAAALLDFDLQWIYPSSQTSYLSCKITPEELEEYLSSASPLPTAIYITSPDYLGNMVDLQGISSVCKRYKVLLAVDNAHGSYLKFLSPSLHPMDLGADICCDSAHKTLPALTGGAYLHISPKAPSLLQDHAKQALSLFASTSPSYLILESLDAVNHYLSGNYGTRLAQFLTQANQNRTRLEIHGFHFIGDEPLKWTIHCKSYGYYGTEIADYLSSNGIVCEFYDPDYLVLMLTPEIGCKEFEKLVDVLLDLPRRLPILRQPPLPIASSAVISPRTATFSLSEDLAVEDAEGRILADPSVGCPPAVPIAVCGERITSEAVAAFRYYGITHCRVCIE